MANLDLSGFENKPDTFQGLNELANTVRQTRQEDRRFAQEQEGKKAATSKFLTDYLDPKDHLTGTAYDPQIVSGLQSLLQNGEQLASKGADTNSILMALGPQVAKLNQYSTTAKQINDNIKTTVQKLKAYPGYNLEAIEDQAKKQAFYGPDGKLKDISSVDPTQNYVALATQNNPELVTTGKGLDDFIAKTPMNESSMTATTAYGGRSQQSSFDTKFHDWMTPQKDKNGNIATDENGMVLPMVVKGTPMLDDKNQPIINKETGKPYMAMDKGYFNAIMMHNPDVADLVRGEVNTHFKAVGDGTVPSPNSPQWDMMARHILGDELQTRDHSILKKRDVEKESAQAIKIDLAQNPGDLDAIAKFNAAQRGTGDYAVYNPKANKAVKTNAVEAVGKIFNNDPDFLQGEPENINGHNAINVTQYFPGGGLKSGRGSDEVYKQIYYDPEKRVLMVSTQPKTKDAQGNKPTDLETIPENKIGFFMSRIAASNGVDPSKVSSIMSQLGYNNAKFQNVGDASPISSRANQEQAEKVDTAIKSSSWKSLEGVPTKDGPIAEISERTKSSWLPNVDRYAVYVKGADGKPYKAFTTSDKAELEKYIKSGSASQGGQSKKAILD